MGEAININVLKGIDDNASDQLKSAFKFVCNQLNIVSNVNLVTDLKLDSNRKDFLIVHLDEITLEQKKNQIRAKDFFLSQAFDKSQILLILEDIGIEDLPDYLHYFPAFELNMMLESQNELNVNKNTALIQVVHDIVLFLRENNTNKSEGLTIFVGPSDDNTTSEFQKIIRELLHRNHHIIPKILNPTAKEIIENPQLISTILSGAKLCIHFIAHKSINNYPEKLSPAMKVNEIVANYCKQNNRIHRIIYVPDEDEKTTENVRLKILQFKSNLEALQSAELVQTPVEKFKNIVLTKIQEIILPDNTEDKINEKSNELYLIYAPGYEKEVKIVKDWLDSSQLNYSVSQVELDQLDLIKYHKKKLKNCTGVLIFSHGNSAWLSRKLSDLLKAPGWGRAKAFQYKIVLGKGNEEPEKMGQMANSIKFLNINDKMSFDELKKIIQN